MESFWLFVTNIGKDEVFIIALTLYTLLVNPLGGRYLGLAFAASYLLNTALKYGLNVKRPFADNPASVSEAVRQTAGGPSMPSGHAQLGTTLWLGMSAQLARPLWWGVFGSLAFLVSLSRLVLGVHRPLEVLVGLLLGASFAALAWWMQKNTMATLQQWRWLAIFPLLVALLLPSGVPGELSAGLGLLAGFLFIAPRYQVPNNWSDRLLVGVLGVLLVLLVYVALSALPSELKDIAAVRALRYGLLVLTVGEVVPLLLRRWLPVTTNGAPVAAEQC